MDSNNSNKKKYIVFKFMFVIKMISNKFVKEYL